MIPRVTYRLVSLALSVSLLCIGGTSEQVRSVPAQGHVRDLLDSLPVGSRLRQSLQRGAVGPGIRYSWMDQMRRQGIRRAVVRTLFSWHGKPKNISASTITYFSEYDDDCAQITESQRLMQIHASGLDEALGRAAVERTSVGHWLHLSKRTKPKRGVAYIELFDDEWLPSAPPALVPVPNSRLFDAVNLDDIAGIKEIIHTEAVKPREHETALWATLVQSQPCLTKALLNGQDPNLRDVRGFTLLMEAVRYSALRTVEVLLRAGADVNAKASQGETAMSIARQEGNQQIMSALKKAGARN